MSRALIYFFKEIDYNDCLSLSGLSRYGRTFRVQEYSILKMSSPGLLTLQYNSNVSFSSKVFIHIWGAITVKNV